MDKNLENLSKSIQEKKGLNELKIILKSAV
jgi:hypothetical protein